MTILKGEISEEINREFRKLAMERFGYEKGALSKAIEEAIIKWIMDQKQVDTQEEKERILNNKVFQKEKDRLYKEFPNKYITICQGKIAEIGDELPSTLERTKLNHLNNKHCLIINTSKRERRRRAGLGWQMKRIQRK